MTGEPGLRDRRKAETRRRLADAAARLFGELGYENVSVSDVARVAEVSDQTVYNYYPNKQDLVLDRAAEIRERYRQAVLSRPEGTSPARALQVLSDEDVDRYIGADLALARGEYPALCVASPTLRRFALEERERQAQTVADAARETDLLIPPLVARAHAAALIAVIAAVLDQIGAGVLSQARPGTTAGEIRRTAGTAFDYLDADFRTLVAPSSGKKRYQ